MKKICLFLLVLSAVVSVTSCDKGDDVTNNITIIVTPDGSGNGNGNGNGSENEGYDYNFLFVVNGQNAAEVTTTDAFWLTLRPTRETPGGRFRVWYHYEPNGIMWDKNSQNRHENIIPYFGKNKTEILYAQYEDAQGNVLSAKKGLTINYR